MAELHNRDPGAEFGDDRLAEAQRLLEEAVGNSSIASDGPYDKMLGLGDRCSVSCGDGCGSCSADGSCDKPACNCTCDCNQEGTCNKCGWCGCDWCGEEQPKYECTASCTGVGGSDPVARGITVDGENDFTHRDFASWTSEEDGNATLVFRGLVTVAKKDIAGRLVSGSDMGPALATWADLLDEFRRWAKR